jgi:hypothetical protein
VGQLTSRHRPPRRRPPGSGGAYDPNASPIDLVHKTPKGQLKNPYNDKISEIAEQGHKTFLDASCNGCLGGGGMCPALSNDAGNYHPDDDAKGRSGLEDRLLDPVH